MKKKESVLLLGGAGFIGSHLARALAGEYEVTVFDRPQVSLANLEGIRDQIDFVGGDFFAAVAEAGTIASKFDHLFHLVWSTLPASSERDPELDLETNVHGTQRFLERLEGKRLKRLVFISSGGTVYGNADRLPVGEDAPTRPICSYGRTKLMVERLLEELSRRGGLDSRVARISNIYGERQGWQRGQGLIAIALHRLISGEPLEVWGDGSAVRDYIYAGDAAKVLRLMLSYQGPHRVFNVSSGAGHSVNDILQTIAEVTGRKPAVHYNPDRSFEVRANVLDNRRAIRELGWQPEIELTAGIGRTWNWLVSQATQGKS